MPLNIFFNDLVFIFIVLVVPLVSSEELFQIAGYRPQEQFKPDKRIDGRIGPYFELSSLIKNVHKKTR